MRIAWVLSMVFCVAAVVFGSWCLTRPDTSAAGIVCLAAGAYGVYQLVYTALYLRKFQ